MRKFLLGVVMLMQMLIAFADKGTCKSEIVGYKVLKNSLFPFSVDGKKACFFAFYTANPNPVVDAQGDGNIGDSVWYGYYELRNPDKIYEFPKPSDIFWSLVCEIDAVSFWDMNGDKKPDVTVIGSCKGNAMHYTIPFVFIRSGGKYILDENVYNGLYGFISLTIADVHGYMKYPSREYREILGQRYLSEAAFDGWQSRVELAQKKYRNKMKGVH